ncbi:carbamoyltransferase C-terminal domain-containing protein [Altericista sp. CCNU0014]|uniref:carbamoyltransferase C-terminal domain-containing protein n=1 Tax=Altericista sp. CCNU0014 TaxID=3082949 RepID=UPI00384A9CD5
MTKILGISDGMTGGAALIEGGAIRYAIHEERLIRAKMATGFPQRSIQTVLDGTRTQPEEIDGIAIATLNEVFREEAIAYNGWLMQEQAPLKELMLSVSSGVNQVFGANPLLQQSYYGLKSALGASRRKAIAKRLRQEWGFTCPIRFVEHHCAHACSAYYTSGLRNATVITMDGAGDNTSSRVYAVKDGKFTALKTIDSFNSLGNYYAYITHLCGFKAQRHEGKITGLAAYGQPIYLDTLKTFVAHDTGHISNRGQVFYWAAVKALQKALPPSCAREDLAASVQQLLEELGGDYIRYWVEQTGIPDVALAGGVFANVKFNQTIHELENVRSIFIHPGMGDEGLAVGAAFALAASAAAKTGQSLASTRLADVYLGPEYGDRQIEQAIDRAGLSAQQTPNIEREVAQLLASGKVVARFDGRMEYGPRALGNRSILYQPTDPTVNEWLNQHLKRTEFMPFAPVTLAEFANRCYENIDGAYHPANFMTVTFNCTPWMKQHCPAVVHVDGTARPQLVEQQMNPSYYQILDEYRKLTGLPSIINTSFNMHEEPIVCTPEDAIRGFLQGCLDHLAIGNFLLQHPER